MHNRKSGWLKFAYWLYRLQVDIFQEIEIFILKIFVDLNLPSRYALQKIAKHSLVTLYEVINSGVKVKIRVNEVYEVIKKCTDFGSKIDITDLEFNQTLAEAYLIMGKSSEWKKACFRLIENQERLRQKFPAENIRFLEAGEIFRNFGTTLVLDAWIKSQILGLREQCRSLVLVDPRENLRPVNPCLLNYWSSYIEFIEDQKDLNKYLPISKDLCAPINYYLPTGDRVVPYTHSAVVYIQKLWEEQGSPPLIRLSDEHVKRGLAMLKRMGLTDQNWFVVTHVRDPGFKGQESFRDSDIFTYLKAYREIISRGGVVIRMGDSSMKPLPKIDGLIDYALSPDKSDWLDIYLLSNARFMLGTSSGPTTVSYIFNVPVVMTNNLPSAATYLSKKDIFMPRLLKRFDGSVLPLKQSMSLPYSMGSFDAMYKNILEVNVIPNTEEEIAQATLEMLQKLDGQLRYTEEDEILQSRFKKIMADSEVLIGLPGFELEARIANFFLNKHKSLVF